MVQKHQQDKIKFNFCSKKQKFEEVTQTLTTSVPRLSPQSKVKAVSELTKKFSPESKATVANNITSDNNPLVDFVKDVSKTRDKILNCACHLALGKIVNKAGGDWKNVRRVNHSMSWKSLKASSHKNFKNIIKHYKTQKSNTPKPPTETRKKGYQPFIIMMTYLGNCHIMMTILGNTRTGLE